MKIQAEKIGDGIWFLNYGSPQSLLVEFKDYLVIIEGPTGDDRSMATIAEAKRMFPNKPIKYLVNTHVHFDHSGGVRTYVAEGATIVTHEMNKPYYEKAWAAPRTLNPDKMSQANKTATFETFSDKHVLTDGKRSIEVYPIAGNGHSSAALRSTALRNHGARESVPREASV